MLEIQQHTLTVGSGALKALSQYTPSGDELSLALAAQAATIVEGGSATKAGQSMIEAAAQEAVTARQGQVSAPRSPPQAARAPPRELRPARPLQPSASPAQLPPPLQPTASTSAPPHERRPDQPPQGVDAPPQKPLPTRGDGDDRAPNRTVQADIVLEYRTGKRTQQLVLHVQDSGGQARFLALLDMLHAPQACVGAVCFSLPELEAAGTRGECVDQIRFQLDAFATRGRSTPLLLIGTRKGDVASAQLPELSSLLDRELRGCPAYDRLVRNAQEEDLAFFGVENSRGIEGDPTIPRLISAVEDAARELPSMKLRVPPGWIAVSDELFKLCSAEQPRPHLSRAELLELAARCGMPHKPQTMSLEREVDVMLGYMHSLGTVLWFDLPRLRELVVIDPQWIVDGISLVIRNFGIHKLKVDVVAERKADAEWEELKRRGILGHKLLVLLWSEPRFAQYREELLQLMEYFSFVVPVPGADVKYLVPALLDAASGVVPAASRDALSLVLHFELADRCARHGELLVMEAALQRGFLPEGVIHHLLSRWGQKRV